MYRGYIRSFCRRSYYDNQGLVHYGVDEDMASRVENQLLYAVSMQFSLEYDGDK